MTGKRNAIKDVITAPPSSIVARMGFPNPAVVAVEAVLARTVEPWMRPATPPPAMMAKVHFNIGSIFEIIEAVITVPATIAAGVAMVSRR